jgi:aspartate aminotransferase
VKLVKVLQSQSSTCLPRFIEEGSIVALNEGKSIVYEAIAELKENRDLATSLLKEIDDIDMIPPQGAFYAYIDIRNALAKSSEFERSNSLGFSERLLEKYHVAMVPGEAFGTPGFLRLNYGVSKDVLKEGISRIKKAIEELV